jgi:hypothetical protein
VPRLYLAAVAAFHQRSGGEQLAPTQFLRPRLHSVRAETEDSLTLDSLQDICLDLHNHTILRLEIRLQIRVEKLRATSAQHRAHAETSATPLSSTFPKRALPYILSSSLEPGIFKDLPLAARMAQGTLQGPIHAGQCRSRQTPLPHILIWAHHVLHLKNLFQAGTRHGIKSVLNMQGMNCPSSISRSERGLPVN